MKWAAVFWVWIVVAFIDIGGIFAGFNRIVPGKTLNFLFWDVFFKKDDPSTFLVLAVASVVAAFLAEPLWNYFFRKVLESLRIYEIEEDPAFS